MNAFAQIDKRKQFLFAEDIDLHAAVGEGVAVDPDQAGATMLHLRFKLRISPKVFLSHSREAASIIAAVEGLVWKIWILKEEELEMGGMYLFASREAAEAYLQHPVIQRVRSNPDTVSVRSELWEVEESLSGITRAPLPLRAHSESRAAD